MRNDYLHNQATFFNVSTFNVQPWRHLAPLPSDALKDFVPPMSDGRFGALELTRLKLKRFRDVSFFRKLLQELTSTQVPDESNSNPCSRWQLKVTVYRLLVISTTISLGSAKAVAIFHGKSYVSTTIAWIAGVAVLTVLSLFLLCCELD